MPFEAPPAPPDIFDRRRRALRRARNLPDGQDFIGSAMAAGLLERLDDVSRRFGDALLIGARHPLLAEELRRRCDSLTVVEPARAVAAGAGAVAGQEDALPVEPESFDLVLWPGGLESVNDVPGALLRCRLALRPDGLLLGCFPGDGSLPRLRAAFAGAEADRPAARFHPQVDLRGLGELVTRIGLRLAVVDVDRMDLRYRSMDALIADLRANALTAVLAGPVPPLRRDVAAAARAAFEGGGDGGRESLRILHFSGWAPHESQPVPARRGSGTVSLARALKDRGEGRGS